MSTDRDPAFEFVKKLGQELSSNEFDLPPFPDTALRVQEAVNDPNASVARLSAIIMSEPALVARLLRMANSALMRRSSIEVTDVKEAISRIGLDMVQNVAVSYAAREAFQAPSGSLLLEKLEATRRHSIKVATLAYFLGRRVKFEGRADEAMLAGLLHAVGKFYILTRAGDFPELFSDDMTLAQLLEQWHASVGRAIVESWGFPESIAQAVDEYELMDREEAETADITDLVLVASLIVNAEEQNNTELLELEDLPSLSRMKLDAAELRSLLEQSEEEIRSMTQAMGG